MTPPSIRKHLWWLVPDELAGMPLPWICEQRRAKPESPASAFDDDVKYLSSIGIRSLVAALDLPTHRKIFQHCGFHYLSLHIPDGDPPTFEEADALVNFYDTSPRPMAVHCEGGVGRTSTLLAVLLLHRGLSASAAIKTVRSVMPPAFENSSQFDFISHCEKHFKRAH